MEITLPQARRLAVKAQLLCGPRPAPVTTNVIVATVKHLGCLQLDPTAIVARNHLLVLFSRLGVFDPALVDAALWRERRLFEYWAHMASIVPTEDRALHEALPPYWTGTDSRTEWMDARAEMRDTVLSRLASEGPLRARDFESGGTGRGSGWYSGGSDIKNMLGLLWSRLAIVPVGREGGGRSWALTENWLTDGYRPLAREAAVDEAVTRSLRALGVGTARQIKNHFIRGRYHDLDAGLRRLAERGEIVATELEGKPGFYVHRDDVGGWDDFQPRSTLLSPFDNLVCDRSRTLDLWDFDFKLEIYVPKSRRWGYFVMPLLRGDRLVARFDLAADRKARVLRVLNERWEPGCRPGKDSAAALLELARFAGLSKVGA